MSGLYNPQLETFVRVADAGGSNKAADTAEKPTDPRRLKERKRNDA